MSDNRPAQIVIVEDDQDDSFMLTRQLQRASVDDLTVLFTDGQDALDYLISCSGIPLVIFLDLHLPGLSGIEVLTTLRRESQLKDIAVIVMTGSLNPDDLNRCNALGVTAYLTKPVGLADFIRAVAHLFPQT